MYRSTERGKRKAVVAPGKEWSKKQALEKSSDDYSAFQPDSSAVYCPPLSPIDSPSRENNTGSKVQPCQGRSSNLAFPLLAQPPQKNLTNSTSNNDENVLPNRQSNLMVPPPSQHLASTNATLKKATPKVLPDVILVPVVTPTDQNVLPSNDNKNNDDNNDDDNNNGESNSNSMDVKDTTKETTSSPSKKEKNNLSTAKAKM
jgi:hypothetical protein